MFEVCIGEWCIKNIDSVCIEAIMLVNLNVSNCEWDDYDVEELVRRFKHYGYLEYVKTVRRN